MLLDIFGVDHTYDDDYESFCNQNCIRQLLEYYGIKNAPFFINSSLSLTLLQDEQNSFHSNLLFDKKLVLHNYEEKIKIIISQNKHPMEVWKENKAKLDEGIPLIVGVDPFYLDYAPSFHTVHSDHRIILCGYIDTEGYATVIDSYQWAFKGNVGIDSFLEARSSLCPKDHGPYSGSPINNIWLEVDKHGWDATFEELLFETVSRSLEYYYPSDSFHQTNHYAGINALKKILEMMLQHQETKTREDSEFLQELRVAFLFIYARLRLFKSYIQASALIVKLGILSRIREHILEEIRIWELLLRVMIKAIYRGEVPYAKLMNYFNTIITSTEERYELLTQLNSTLL